MMEKLSKAIGIARPEYVIVLLLIAILGLLEWVVADQRFFLNFYFLPVVVAGYTLGVRGGVLAAVASSVFVTLFFVAGKPELIPTEPDSVVRAWWADIALWACFLILSGAAVGKLYERSKVAMDDLQQA